MTGNADFAGRSTDTQPGSSRSTSGICTTNDTSINATGIFTFTANSCKKSVADSIIKFSSPFLLTDLGIFRLLHLLFETNSLIT